MERLHDCWRKISPLTPTQPIENTDRVSDGSLWLSQPPQRGGGCLVPYRQVRRRRVAAWTRLCPAGALAIGGFGRSRWRLRRTRAGHIIINGYSMVVSPFDRLRSGRTRIDNGQHGEHYYHPKPTVASEKIAARRTRDSVRRASDFVQIPITRIEGPSLRGLWGAPRQAKTVNQLLKKTCRQCGRGAGCRKIFLAFRQGEVFFT